MSELQKLADAILEDGVIDAAEVEKLRKHIYADGMIEREEADALFRLNDRTSGQPNHSSWKTLFVEALTDHLLADASSPGALDEEESQWLLARMDNDGQLDANEQALVENLKKKANSLPKSFTQRFG